MVNPKDKRTWYVYLLEIDTNKGPRLYCGYADDINKGLWCLLSHKYNSYVNRFYKTNRKKVVYVEYVKGTEYDAMGRVLDIKRIDVKSKRKLIKGNNNRLITYRPNQVIILQDIDDCSKQCAIPLYSDSIF